MSYHYHYINNEYEGSAQALMKELSASTNLNASGLARAMKVAPSTVTRILQGKTCPSYDDMRYYAWCLAYTIDEDNKLVRPEHLRSYSSPADLGVFLNTELAQGLDNVRLKEILRALPKEATDWQRLDKEDRDKLLLQPPRVKDIRFQALLEGITSYVSHSFFWEDAPAWTNETTLTRVFVPRGATRELGKLRFERLAKKCSPEFMGKNVLFTHDEMQVI
jgi:hypothetical protein